MKRILLLIFIITIIPVATNGLCADGPIEVVRKTIYYKSKLDENFIHFLCKQTDEIKVALFKNVLKEAEEKERENLNLFGFKKISDIFEVDLSKVRFEVREKENNYQVIETFGFLTRKSRLTGESEIIKEENFYTVIKEGAMWKVCASYFNKTATYKSLKNEGQKKEAEKKKAAEDAAAKEAAKLSRIVSVPFTFLDINENDRIENREGFWKTKPTAFEEKLLNSKIRLGATGYCGFANLIGKWRHCRTGDPNCGDGVMSDIFESKKEINIHDEMVTLASIKDLTYKFSEEWQSWEDSNSNKDQSEPYICIESHYQPINEKNDSDNKFANNIKLYYTRDTGKLLMIRVSFSVQIQYESILIKLKEKYGEENFNSLFYGRRHTYQYYWQDQNNALVFTHGGSARELKPEIFIFYGKNIKEWLEKNKPPKKEKIDIKF